MDLYPETKIRYLMRYAFDHCLILIPLENWCSRGRAPLKFEEFWLRCPGVYDVVKNAWSIQGHYSPGI